MKILGLRALRGPNYYHNQPVIIMELDIEELENTPTDVIANFRENIEVMMPTLIEHTCSPGRRGGFFERVTRGTWAGHVVEHVAIELQVLAGNRVSFGKTFTGRKKGMYRVVLGLRQMMLV